MDIKKLAHVIIHKLIFFPLCPFMEMFEEAWQRLRVHYNLTTDKNSISLNY